MVLKIAGYILTINLLKSNWRTAIKKIFFCRILANRQSNTEWRQSAHLGLSNAVPTGAMVRLLMPLISVLKNKIISHICTQVSDGKSKAAIIDKPLELGAKHFGNISYPKLFF